MKTFYEKMRLERKVLMNRDFTPWGGKWSFDDENRKKMPLSVKVPPQSEQALSRHYNDVLSLVRKDFHTHPGDLPTQNLWIPTNRPAALTFLSRFITTKLESFGPYEDAIETHDDFLFHSGLSQLINIGFLSPREVIGQALLKKDSVPLSSLEGFIRQIMGWREFINGIHQSFHSEQSTRNFFNHQAKMKPCWYEGTTGLPPVDDAIKKVLKLGYNHHIERLMVLSNSMLLSEIFPAQIHQWFMEMYIDSYEWVMGPNVYGMGQFSDGGIFATKPYISGSNYILKMSHYEKGDWCKVWDGLYWSFIAKNSAFFSKNPRLSMMTKLLEKMDARKKETLFACAHHFKKETTTLTI